MKKSFTRSPADAARTQVAIIGAGPAGLLLGRLLGRAGIDAVVVERHDRAYCEARLRAGLLEQGTVQLLAELGIDARMRAEGMVHRGFELRFGPDDARESHRIALEALTGGRTVTVYGQTELVKDLIAARLADGLELWFDAPAAGIEGLPDGPVVVGTRDGRRWALQADLVVACDGFHGVGRQAMPAGLLRTFAREYPYAWLGVLADVPPSTEEVIYANHARGMSMHSMRTPELSRFYLQVPPDEPLARWPDARIWTELARRLALPGWALRPGPIIDRSVTRLRSFVAAPMRAGRLLLAGDAAHIVPPTGAKGLNLAAADVAVLGPAIVAALRDGDERGLDEYSRTCLRRVWRTEDFSAWMTELLHVWPDDPDGFAAELQVARLRYVCRSEAAMRSLAENYVGIDPALT